MTKSLSNSDEGGCSRWTPFCEDQNERKRGLALAFRIMGDRSDAEEVVQEAYFRIFIYANADSIEDKPNYFLKTVQRLSLSRLVNRSRVMLINAVSLDGPVTEESEEAPMEIPDPGCNPEMNAQYKKENTIYLRIVRTCTQKLTRREKALFLSHLRGFTIDEIANAWCEDVADIAVEMNAVKAKLRHRCNREKKKQERQ